MRWNLFFGAIIASVGLCSQSFGAGLLERMLGGGCGSCCNSCCEAPTCAAPSCAAPSCCAPSCAAPSCCAPTCAAPSCCAPSCCEQSSCCRGHCHLFTGLHCWLRNLCSCHHYDGCGGCNSCCSVPTCAAPSCAAPSCCDSCGAYGNGSAAGWAPVPGAYPMTSARK